VKGEVLGIKPLQVLLGPPHIRHGLAWVTFININYIHNVITERIKLTKAVSEQRPITEV
jgi:hypothetical protein